MSRGRSKRRKGWLYLVSGVNRHLGGFPPHRGPAPIRLMEPKAWVEPVLLIGDLKLARPVKWSDGGYVDVFACGHARQERATELGWTDGRYLVRFPYYRREGQSAQRVADALDATLRLLHGPTLRDHARAIGFPRALQLPVPASRANGAPIPDCSTVVSRSDLVRHDRSRDDDQVIGDLMIGSLLEECIWVPELDEALEMLPVSVRSPYFEAVHFYRESIEHFYFYDPDIRMTLADRERAPATQVERTRVEAAVWQAFKALEAIIGDPPKDERKFQNKLQSHGIDPDEQVGFQPCSVPESEHGDTPLEAMSAKIRKMGACRDKRAAHGSRTGPDRTISYYELMDFQACSQVCVITAIRHCLDTGRGECVN